jgi:hypothetical protein
MKVYKYQRYGKTSFYSVSEEDYELLTQTDNYLFGTKALTHEEKEEILKDAKLITNTKAKIYRVICFIIGLGLNIVVGQKGTWYAIITFFAFYMLSFIAIAVIKAFLQTLVFDKSSGKTDEAWDDFMPYLLLSYILPILAGVLPAIIVLFGGQIR